MDGKDFGFRAASVVSLQFASIASIADFSDCFDRA